MFFLLTFVSLTQSFALIIQFPFAYFSNIFICSAVLRCAFNGRNDRTDELKLEKDLILEGSFDEVDFEDELLE